MEAANKITRIFKGKNSKFLYLRKSFKNRHFKLLDIGAGNHSASRTRFFFPQCEYYGLDISRDYNNSEEDFKAMSGFYELDLTQLAFDKLPDNYFDGIWMAHIIEHLHNGDKVIEHLLPKLRKGGFLYVEYPGARSLHLPYMYGTLNFHDDSSHVRVYSVKELASLFTQNGCAVIRSGIRRNPFFILATPFRILYSLLKGERLTGNIFWDILGFAEYLYVQKKQ